MQRFRPSVHNIRGIQWGRILELVAHIENKKKTDLVTAALSTFLECQLDDIVASFENENPKNFLLGEMKKYLEALRRYNE